MNNFFCIICIIVFLFKTETVFSDNLIYDVNNIEVSGKINNYLDKKKLTDEAFLKAFKIFVNKTLLAEDATDLYGTKIKTIKDLIFSYQIVSNERHKEKENILLVNVKFDKQKINEFFSKKKISYADISNISLTLLPILIKNTEVFMYEDNFFYNNWILKEKEILKEKLITYNMALESIEDLQYINTNKENLELINVKKINSLKNEDNYVYLTIYSIKNEFRAYIKTFIGKKEINKNISLKAYSNNETKSYEQAIILIKKEIEQIWKKQNLIDISVPSYLDFFLDIKQINDYLKLRSILDSIDIIESYSMLELSNKYAKIRIKYNGKLNKIKDKLLDKKINILINDNVWNLRIN